MDIDKEGILTLEEVSRYLKLSVDTIYRMVNRGDIPGFKIGRSWRFRKDGIDEYLLKKEKQRSKKVQKKRTVKKRGGKR